MVRQEHWWANNSEFPYNWHTIPLNTLYIDYIHSNNYALGFTMNFDVFNYFADMLNTQPSAIAEYSWIQS